MFIFQKSLENDPFSAKISCPEIVFSKFNRVFLLELKGSDQNVGVIRKALTISSFMDALKKCFAI